MKECRKCGKRLEDFQSLCLECGTWVNPAEREKKLEQISVEKTETASSKAKSAVIAATVILAVIIVITIIAMKMLTPEKKEVPTADTATVSINMTSGEKPSQTAHGDVTKKSNLTISGTCGDGLTWRLVGATATLTVSGNGNMDSWNHDSGDFPPWYSNRHLVENVIIEGGVSSVGIQAFFDCAGILSVMIPDSVTEIGDKAFEGCDALTVYASAESYAGIYAEEKGIPFVPVN